MMKRIQIENATDVGTYGAVLATNTLVSGLRRLNEAKTEITCRETIVGDDHCGVGIKRGAEAVLHHVLDQPLAGSAILDLASILSMIETSTDGTSGALYAIFLDALLHAFQTMAPGVATPGAWTLVLEQSSSALARYTLARVGDRTVIDALDPFIQQLGQTGELNPGGAGCEIWDGVYMLVALSSCRCRIRGLGV